MIGRSTSGHFGVSIRLNLERRARTFGIVADKTSKKIARDVASGGRKTRRTEKSFRQMISEGPVRITMNSGHVYEIPSPEFAIISDIPAYVLVRAMMANCEELGCRS